MNVITLVLIIIFIYVIARYFRRFLWPKSAIVGRLVYENPIGSHTPIDAKTANVIADLMSITSQMRSPSESKKDPYVLVFKCQQGTFVLSGDR